jgi:hypothetical protein
VSLRAVDVDRSDGIRAELCRRDTVRYAVTSAGVDAESPN